MSSTTLLRISQVDAALAAPVESLDLDAVLLEYRQRQMLEQLTGPVVSVLAHLVLLVLCFFFIRSETPKTEDGMMVTISQPPDTTFEPITPPQSMEIDQLPSVAPVPAMEPPPAQTTPATIEIVCPPFIQDDVPVVLENSPKIVADTGIWRPITKNQNTPQNDAVLRALRWLKATQRPDGSWAGEKGGHPCAMTGLAILAFLGHNETLESDEFGPTLSRSLIYLSERMMAAPDILEREYSHAIASYALSEAYAVTLVPQLKPAMEKGLSTIVRGQQIRGGWGYQFTGSPFNPAVQEAWDLSVSGWQIQALKAGYLANADVPGMAEAIERSRSFIQERAFNAHKASFMYSPGTSRASMQGVGALCLQLHGLGKSDEAKKALRDVTARKPLWRDPARDSTAAHNNAAYTWYYDSQVYFNSQSAQFLPWFTRFGKELANNQQTIASGQQGFWDPPPPTDLTKFDRSDYDRVYTTTLCCLILEVPDRYLPSVRFHSRKEEPTLREDDIMAM